MIYADHNASAPISQEVKQYLIQRLKNGPYANPNSIHHLGNQTMLAIENARAICADMLGATLNQIIFNSGASEGIATIFNSLINNAKNTARSIIIISEIEHSAVFNTAKYYKSQGFKVETLPTQSNGIVNIDLLDQWLNEFGNEVICCSLIAAHNETGIIQPFMRANQICQKFGVPFFSDTTQYIGKTPFNFNDSDIDYAVISGHKVGSLIGSGLLLAKNPKTIHPIIRGGGQENGYRAGTQNYIGCECLAIALKACQKELEKIDRLKKRKEEFERKIRKNFPKTIIIGENSPRLAGTTYISYPGIQGQAVQIELEAMDIFVTTSSACSDNQAVTSRTLKSMGVNDEVGRGVIRISIGASTPLEQYDKIYDALCATYEKLSRIKNY